jgi:hypothetical protein
MLRPMRHLLLTALFACACGAADAGQSRYPATANFVSGQAPEALKLDAQIVDCDDDVLLVLGPDCELRGKWDTVDALIRVGGGSFRAGSFALAADQTCTVGSHALKISSGVVKVTASRVADVSLGATEGDHPATLTFTTGASGPLEACPSEPHNRYRRSPL